jgi:hypothetical protein
MRVALAETARNLEGLVSQRRPRRRAFRCVPSAWATRRLGISHAYANTLIWDRALEFNYSDAFDFYPWIPRTQSDGGSDRVYLGLPKRENC